MVATLLVLVAVGASISLAVVTAAAGRETVARRAAERSEEELRLRSISPT